MAAQQIADIVLDLPADPPRPYETHTTAPQAGLYFFTGKEGEATLELVQDGEGWALCRNHGLTPLHDGPDGGWQIGYLPDRLRCTAEGLLWDAGAKTTLLHRLEQAKEEGNQSLLGSYSSEELTLTLDIHAQDGLLWCYHPRYGSDPMMQIDDTHFIYWQERSSAFLVTLYPDGSLTLDAGRCLNMVFQKR